jgi:ApaG protein
LKGQFFFAYRIRITNNSQRPVQLLRRHWIVTDANGRTENIWGVGVVGEQPVIFPRTGFEYSSACPLNTPNGRMVTSKSSTTYVVTLVNRLL